MAGRRRLNRARRLSGPADYRAVFRRPRKQADSQFLLLFCANGRPNPRLGLALSRRRIPKATARNRVKRIVRESFRVHAERLRKADIVVLAQQTIQWRDPDRLVRSLETHWEKLKSQIYSFSM